MLKKCLSPAMLLKANAIMEQVSKDVETNMTQEQINALIKYQLNDNAADNPTVCGSGRNKYNWYMLFQW